MRHIFSYNCKQLTQFMNTDAFDPNIIYILEIRKIKKRISIYVASEQGLNAAEHLNRRD